MPQFRPKPSLDGSAVADLFRNTLSKIPSVFGKLSYLSGLRDANTGIYRHHGLASIFGRDESKRALSESHHKVFRQWLNLPLEQKKNDLDLYLDSLVDSRASVLSYWSKTPIHQTFIPSSALRREKALYQEEFQILLRLLGCNPGSQGPQSGCR